MTREKKVCQLQISRIACFLSCVLFLVFTGYSLSTQSKTEDKNQQSQIQKTMEKDVAEEQPFACNMAAMNKEQRVRYTELTKQLFSSKQEIKELTDGYAFRFAASAENIKNAAEFIAFERLCCPFFDFNLTVEKNNGFLWLKLSGGEGIKEFIKSEFRIES